MPTDQSSRTLAGPLYGQDPWPLRFFTHNFGVACHNTTACSVIYNRHEFGTRKSGSDGRFHDHPSGPPCSVDWRIAWDGHHGILPEGGETFPGVVEMAWASLDGASHELQLDFDQMFRDRLVLHHVSRNEVRERWLEVRATKPVVPSILVEVDDRTVNVYMRATVATEAEQIPGNPNSHARRDLVLAWSRTS